MNPYVPLVSFNHDEDFEFFNCHLKKVIDSFIENNKQNYETLENERLIYFKIPIDDNYSIECLKLKEPVKDYQSFFNWAEYPIIKSVYSVCKRSGGVGLSVTYNISVNNLFELLAKKHPEDAEAFKRGYRIAVSWDYEAVEIADAVDSSIEFFKKWAKDNNQIKDAGQNNSIKEFFGKYEVYYLKENVLIFFSSPSAKLFGCKFTKKGYKLYSDESGRCGEREQDIKRSFDPDTEDGFDRLYLKHGFKERSLIMEKTYGEKAIPYAGDIKSLEAFIIPMQSHINEIDIVSDDSDDVQVIIEDDNDFFIDRY